MMPRPTHKSDLLALSQLRYKNLNDFIDSFSEEDRNKEFPGGTMNRNFRDVLAHLHHWHLMMLEWYNIGMKGGKPKMPAKGYTWKMTPELNRKIWETYRAADLSEVRKLLDKSFNDVLEMINGHTNDELFEKSRYKWTGTTSLGAYLVSATSSHYDWALKLLKKAKK
jgi:hypothetical protein